ncbi:MOSC domain-containing protein [Myxococcota bacterium]|nr:MOSC domain-containing protein [Myxococcota bacterium]
MTASPSSISLRGVYVGSLVTLSPSQCSSGIDKRPVAPDTPLEITRVGIAGDVQGDRKHHGGPEKAIHHYPYEHYAWWRERFPSRAGRFAHAPAFGENLSSEGWTERDLCIGDQLVWGTARLEVSQGRQPCWRIGVWNDEPLLPREVQRSGRSGWYYRVSVPGLARREDPLQRIHRPHPDWPLTRIQHLLYEDPLDLDGLAGMAALPALAPGWRELAARRLADRRVEDWEGRLTGARPDPGARPSR